MFFFSGKKNQKPRDEKNSLLEWSISLASWFAFSLIGISLAPLFGFMAKKRSTWQLGQFFVT